MKIVFFRFLPLILAILVIASRFFSLWCTDTGRICYQTFLNAYFLVDVINPLYVFSIFFLYIAIGLLIVSDSVFSSWLKFAKWALPISLLFIAITPVGSSGGFIDIFPFYRADAARLAGEIFAVASLILIVWESIPIRRKKS
ncbi:MAG: hypothetical protein WAN50_04265 [Minisyncoccia bacterium]